MAKTTKEHYVPQCYLRNFSNSSEKINVFDKLKMQTRINQAIKDVAAEDGFYEIKIKQILESLEEEQQIKAKQDIAKIINDDKLDTIIDLIDSEQHVEKIFLSNMESKFSNLLKNIIERADQANIWFKENCFALNLEEKELLSICMVLQVLRTRSHRNSIEMMLKDVTS